MYNGPIYNSEHAGNRFYMNNGYARPGMASGRLLTMVTTVVSGIHETISRHRDVVSMAVKPVHSVENFLDSLKAASDHNRLVYVEQAVAHLHRSGVLRKEEETWGNDLFKGDYLVNLAESPKMVSMLALVAVDPMLADDEHPLIKLRIKLAEEYNNGNKVNLSAIDDHRIVFNKLKTLIKENSRNTRQRKAALVDLWSEVIKFYVELKKEILRNSFEKTIWLKDEKAELDNDPKLRPGVRDLVDDVENLIRFTDELPPEVLEVFRKVI